jgi:hypothetical protein
MIETINNTISLLKDKEKEKTDKISVHFYQYLIKNQTGIEIECWVEHKSKLKLKNGDEFEFDIDPKYNLTERCVIFVNIPGKILINNQDFDLQKVNLLKVQKLIIRNEKERILYFIQTSLSNGRKIVTIRSGITIENKTNIEWTLGTELNGKFETFGKIKPKESIGVPKNRIKGILQIKPTIYNTYEFSSPLNIYNFYELIKQINNKPLIPKTTCCIEKETSKKMFAVLNVQSAKKIEQTKEEIKELYYFEQFDINIQLISPLSIENLLAETLEVQLFSKSTEGNSKTSIIDSSIIKKGEKNYLYSMDINNFQTLLSGNN